MITFKEEIDLSKTDEEFILNHLPTEWDTLVKEVNPSNDMEVVININAATIHETNVWFSHFQLLNTTYFIHSSKKITGDKLAFRKLYKCLHNTKTKEVYDPFVRKHIENVKCPSYLLIKMSARSRKKKEKNAKFTHERPCEIRVKLLHNHSLTEGMKIRVLPEIREKLIHLYKLGYTPGTALAKIKTHIRINYKNDTGCPDYRYCAYLFERYRVKSQDHTILKEEYMEKKIANYNNKMGEESAKMYVDETGLVVSEIGGLPLGVIVSTSNSTEILEIAFSLLKNMLGDTAFGGNPNSLFFIVDETLCEQNILRKLWPQCKILIGTSFVLKNVWVWLSKNITSNKLDMFTDFYYMMYSSTEVEFCIKYGENKSKYYHNKKYLKFLNGYYEKRKKWVICFRLKLLLNDIYTESVFQILQTADLLKLQTLKLFQAVDFIQNDFFTYFENRILEAVTIGCVKSILELKEDINSIEKIPMTQIKLLGNDIHLIPDEQNSYNIVNTNSLCCSCSLKNSGIICNHIQWICLLVNSNVFSKKTINISEIRYKYSAIIENLNRIDNFIEAKHTTTEATLSCYGKNSVDIPTENTENSVLPEEDLNKLFENIETPKDTNAEQIINIYNNKKISDTSTIAEGKEKIIEEGKEIWKKVTQIYENFLENYPEEIISATKIMSTNLNKIQTAPEFCTACENFSPQKTTPISSRKEITASKVSLQSSYDEVVVVTVVKSTTSVHDHKSSRSLKSNKSVQNI